MSELRVRGDVFGQRIREQYTEQLGRRLDLLVAGCAREHGLVLDRVETRISGVDDDIEQVRAALERGTDVESWSLGDLRSVPIPPRSFDVIFVHFLLERIHHTELVLDRMLNGLRPGGLLLLRMRDRSSAYGFWDRITPSWLRRLAWPYLTGDDGAGPLPAVYEPVTSREGMLAFCLSRGLMVTDSETATSGPAMGRLGSAAVGLVSRMSRGRYTSAHDEVVMVIRKPQNHFARLI
ncbi:methyltransferase domain-containing protein [Nonomuraea soli]|uniref:SAM-dependent methyltransferase n=1 Tax=Nonomuraea soli TaxID=1032476 RepID=A0A7W0CQT1_9ACTN|nr:class I SAM-dependent methyltransferase [Nonomuraea soli]MBA2895587.1 SAM-dependent methyltransferase [Nonomuraea soli]